MITSATDVRAPGRLRRIAPALGTALVVALAAGYVWAVDPNAGGTYPVCPTQALLGVDCPACGGLRGTHSLLHGDLAGAADNNIALFILLPALAVVWFRWVASAWRGSTAVSVSAGPPSRLLIAVLIAVSIFGVVRNFVPYLGSGIG